MNELDAVKKGNGIDSQLGLSRLSLLFTDPPRVARPCRVNEEEGATLEKAQVSVSPSSLGSGVSLGGSTEWN